MTASVLALAFLLQPVHARWRARRVAMERDPAELLAPPQLPASNELSVLVLACGAVAAALAAQFHPLVPVAMAIAAFASLGVFHLRHTLAAGLAGLALMAFAIVVAAVAWLPATPVGWMFALSLAGAHASWLSRFWRQQLLNGVAWTTTGRLIPASAAIGLLLGLLAVGEFVSRLYAFRPAGASPWGHWPPVMTGPAVLLTVAAVSLGIGGLIRAAADRRRNASGPAAPPSSGG